MGNIGYPLFDPSSEIEFYIPTIIIPIIGAYLPTIESYSNSDGLEYRSWLIE